MSMRTVRARVTSAAVLALTLALAAACSTQPLPDQQNLAASTTNTNVYGNPFYAW